MCSGTVQEIGVSLFGKRKQAEVLLTCEECG